MRRILESIDAPATVTNLRRDYLAANQIGRALYAPWFDSREISAEAGLRSLCAHQDASAADDVGE